MNYPSFAPLISEIEEVKSTKRVGLVSATRGGLAEVSGLSHFARFGDIVQLRSDAMSAIGEVVALEADKLLILLSCGLDGVAIGDKIELIGKSSIRPDLSWLGRVLDGLGNPLDGKPLARGQTQMELRGKPPSATARRRLGAQIETRISALNTFLPLVRGQRLGLFAGSGVGKSTLIAQLAKGIDADYAVIALIGERGREVREFIEDTLGPDGLARSVIVAATSDQSPVERRRAAWTAMAIAEYLRDQGGHVLFLADSLTRFCDAHREIALSSGERASASGYPPSTAQTVMGLCERAGPGAEGQGDITALFSVLVAGSDMEEPIADLVRGVLDGHIVLDRMIAERGRFPAIDVLRSVSRSFETALDAPTKQAVQSAREVLSAYKDAEIMIQAGLYKPGSDPLVDRAITLRPKLESFLSSPSELGDFTIPQHISSLLQILNGP
jgi:flagellum-specific ATP synthase